MILRLNLWASVSILVLTVGASGTAWCGPKAPPLIENGMIQFANGVVLEFSPYKELHTDPLRAHELGEPVSVETKPKLIEAWQRVLLIRTEVLYEDALQKLTILDWQGTQLGPVFEFIGELHILDKSNRILVAQHSVHHFVGESLLIDPNGKVIAKIHQPESASEFGVAADQKLFWIVSYHLSNGEPITRVSLYDVLGRLVKKLDSIREQEWQVKRAGERYTIRVPAPHYPD